MEKQKKLIAIVTASLIAIGICGFVIYQRYKDSNKTSNDNTDNTGNNNTSNNNTSNNNTSNNTSNNNTGNNTDNKIELVSYCIENNTITKETAQIDANAALSLDSVSKLLKKSCPYFDSNDMMLIFDNPQNAVTFEVVAAKQSYSVPAGAKTAKTINVFLVNMPKKDYENAIFVELSGYNCFMLVSYVESPFIMECIDHPALHIFQNSIGAKFPQYAQDLVLTTPILASDGKGKSAEMRPITLSKDMLNENHSWLSVGRFLDHLNFSALVGQGSDWRIDFFEKPDGSPNVCSTSRQNRALTPNLAKQKSVILFLNASDSFQGKSENNFYYYACRENAQKGLDPNSIVYGASAQDRTTGGVRPGERAMIATTPNIPRLNRFNVLVLSANSAASKIEKKEVRANALTRQVLLQAVSQKSAHILVSYQFNAQKQYVTVEFDSVDQMIPTLDKVGHMIVQICMIYATKKPIPIATYDALKSAVAQHENSKEFIALLDAWKQTGSKIVALRTFGLDKESLELVDKEIKTYTLTEQVPFITAENAWGNAFTAAHIAIFYTDKNGVPKYEIGTNTDKAPFSSCNLLGDGPDSVYFFAADVASCLKADVAKLDLQFFLANNQTSLVIMDANANANPPTYCICDGALSKFIELITSVKTKPANDIVLEIIKYDSAKPDSLAAKEIKYDAKSTVYPIPTTDIAAKCGLADPKNSSEFVWHAVFKRNNSVISVPIGKPFCVTKRIESLGGNSQDPFRLMLVQKPAQGKDPDMNYFYFKSGDSIFASCSLQHYNDNIKIHSNFGINTFNFVLLASASNEPTDVTQKQTQIVADCITEDTCRRAAEINAGDNPNFALRIIYKPQDNKDDDRLEPVSNATCIPDKKDRGRYITMVQMVFAREPESLFFADNPQPLHFSAPNPPCLIQAVGADSPGSFPASQFKNGDVAKNFGPLIGKLAISNPLKKND